MEFVAFFLSFFCTVLYPTLQPFLWDGESAAIAVGFWPQLWKREQETEDHECSGGTLKNLKEVSAVVWDCPLSQITPIFRSWAVQVVKITPAGFVDCLHFLIEEERGSQDPSQSTSCSIGPTICNFLPYLHGACGLRGTKYMNQGRPKGMDSIYKTMS